MTDDITHPILTRMSPDERAALKRFRDSLPVDPGEGDAIRMLARDALIGIGDLAPG